MIWELVPILKGGEEHEGSQRQGTSSRPCPRDMGLVGLGGGIAGCREACTHLSAYLIRVIREMGLKPSL